MDYVSLAEPLAALMRRAGEVILEVYAGDIEQETKTDDSPVTKADRLANEVLCRGVQALLPQVPIISEENRQLPYGQRAAYEHYWLIDPLDGTKDFIKRNGEFTVNVALMLHQNPVAAWLYVPCRGELYHAIRGGGAYCTDAKGECRRLQTTRFSLQDPGLKVVCSRSHFTKTTRAFTDTLNRPELVSVGSALKFMLLARGEAHLYPRNGPTMEWDTAAAQLIVEEAGGKVLQFHRQDSPLVYNKENLLNPEFIAYANLV